MTAAESFPHTGVLTGNAAKDWRACPCPDCGIVERYGSRINEGHVGIRFNDWRPNWKIILNGEDVTARCVEALAGENGWALLYQPHKRMCSEGSPMSRHACKNVFWGECSVSTRQEVPR